MVDFDGRMGFGVGTPSRITDLLDASRVLPFVFPLLFVETLQKDYGNDSSRRFIKQESKVDRHRCISY